jgi:hypothetical protein
MRPGLTLCLALTAMTAACGSADSAAPGQPVATPATPASAATTTRPATTTPATTTTAPAKTTTLPPTTTTTTTTTLPPVTNTACRSVVLIGDSTAVGLERAGVLDELARVGAGDVRLEISGGRSMVERLAGQENAVETAERVAATGYSGCWAVVVGANDAANIAAGSKADAPTRVSRMLDAIGGQPTIWMGATSIAGSGFWARPNIQSWNNQVSDLLDNSDSAVFADWDRVASTNSWFVSDGIHPNADGSSAMASFIADHFLFLFPQR